MAHDISKSTLKLINESALWIAAGVSPSLLGTDVPSSAAPDSNSCPSEAKVTGLLADLQRLWFCNDYYIRINGEPVSVEIDVDVTGDSQSLQEVCTVKLHGDCPHCLNVLDTQDNDYSYERRGYCGEDEFLVCECGAEWPLLHGTPSEFRKAVR